METDPRSGSFAAGVLAGEGHHVRSVLLVEEEEPHLQGFTDPEVTRAASLGSSREFVPRYANVATSYAGARAGALRPSHLRQPQP